MYALSKAQAGDICTIKWMFGLPEGQSDHRGAE